MLKNGEKNVCCCTHAHTFTKICCFGGGTLNYKYFYKKNTKKLHFFNHLANIYGILFL